MRRGVSPTHPEAGPWAAALLQDGKKLENELEVVEGMKFDRGYISPYFVTDAKSLKCELTDPYILLVDQKVQGCASRPHPVPPHPRALEPVHPAGGPGHPEPMLPADAQDQCFAN